MLVIGWLGQAGLRVWFSRTQVVPLANPDESAYLIAARVLAGGKGLNISGMTLYQGGYPLLITPVFWFTSACTPAMRGVESDVPPNPATHPPSLATQSM